MRPYFGGLLIVVGVFITVTGGVAWLDPVGSKMADDGDPFGPSVSRYTSSVVVAVGLATCFAGRRVWLRAGRK
jgi:hypothetical protein